MKSQTLCRASLLAIAIAFTMTDAPFLHGQSDSDEMVFEPPKATSAARAAAIMRQTNRVHFAHETTTDSPAPGKAVITQTNATSNPTPSRMPLGTDPKRNLPVPRSTRPASSAATTAAPPAVPSQASPAVGSGSIIKQASHQDPNRGLTPDGLDVTQVPQRPRRVRNLPPQIVTSPADRGTPPAPRGTLLNLNAGEMASERLLQMTTAVRELEFENDELRQQNAGLQTRVKEIQDQLTAATREIQIARKELNLAKNDLSRLRADIQSLREKVRTAENDHKAVLQSMGPLLQQLLEADDVVALPPNPTE